MQALARGVGRTKKESESQAAQSALTQMSFNSAKTEREIQREQKAARRAERKAEREAEKARKVEMKSKKKSSSSEQG